MYLYILLGLMCCVAFWQLAWLDHQPNKRPNILWYYLFICILFALGALRWERGGDWTAYTTHFDYPKDTEGFELGYQYTIETIKWLWNDFSVYLAIGMCVILGLTGSTITRYSPLPLFSLAIFFSANFAGIFFTRQLIAVAICLYSIRYIEQRKLWLFLLSIGIAILYHRTAFLFLFAYPIFRRYFSIWQYVLILGTSTILSLIIGQVIIATVGIFGPVIEAKITVYLQAGEEGYAHGLGDVSPIVVLLKGLASRMLIVVLLLWQLNQHRKLNPTINGLINIYMLGVCFFTFLTPISTVLTRAIIPFDLVSMLLLPWVVIKTRTTLGKLLIYWLLVCYLFFRLNSNIGYYKQLYIPYKSIFNKEQPVEVG